MTYELSVFAVYNIIAATIAILVASSAWQRGSRIDKTLAMAMISLIIWTVAGAFELSSTQVSQKVFWSQVEYIGSMTIPAIYFRLALMVIDVRTTFWLSRRALVILFVIPVITILLAFTNNYHHLIWTSFTPSPAGNNLVVFGHGILYWPFALGYSLLLMLVGIAMLVIWGIRHQNENRLRAFRIALSGILPMISTVFYLSSWSPLPGLDLTPISLIIAGVIINSLLQESTLAELRSANLALEKAVRARDEFLAAMSHELRTPLNAILSMADALEEGVGGPLTDKQTQYTTMITSSGQRLLEVINSVLFYTHIQSGNRVLHNSPLSLAEVMQASLEVVRARAEKKHQVIETAIPNPEIHLLGDGNLLRQVLVILLDNAIKFSPEKGCITLSAQHQPQAKQVKIRVCDNGIGIIAEDLPRLFRPFVQLDARLARNYEGAGLGLALAKALVELHGGSVSVESEAGRGSCFEITLPTLA